MWLSKLKFYIDFWGEVSANDKYNFIFFWEELFCIWNIYMHFHDLCTYAHFFGACNSEVTCLEQKR